MRYWAYLAGKVVLAAAPLYGLLRLLQKSFPPRQHLADDTREAWAHLQTMNQDLVVDLWLLAWFMLCAAVFYLIVWDQRRRCRVCLRRLRMPIETGSRGFTLQFGQPRVESICPYGHGTLSEDEAHQVAGLTSAEWTPHSDDIWQELCAPSKDTGQEP
jgi:hypothetical protein